MSHFVHSPLTGEGLGEGGLKRGAIMFGFGHTEILVILVIVLIIFGAGKLPQIGSGLGQAIRNFKKGVADVEKEMPEKIES